MSTTDSYRRYCSQLATACVSLGQAASRLSNPPQVRVWDPDFESYAELISCRPGPGGAPYFWWSFRAPAGPGNNARLVATLALKAVSPRLQGLPAGRARR